MVGDSSGGQRDGGTTGIGGGFGGSGGLPRPPASGWKGDVVLVANEAGAHSATRHLLRMGHRQLAVITGPASDQCRGEVEGFKRALAEAKVPIEPEYIQEARFNRQSGYQAAARLLRMLPRPTAIFACNDLMAIGVLLAAVSWIFTVPTSSPLSDLTTSILLSLPLRRLPLYTSPGISLHTAARLLLKRIQGSKQFPQKIVLPSELKIRHSVASLSPHHLLLPD